MIIISSHASSTGAPQQATRTNQLGDRCEPIEAAIWSGSHGNFDWRDQVGIYADSPHNLVLARSVSVRARASAR